MHSHRHRVVITGIGLWTSLGKGVPDCWRRLVAGDSGIAPISFWDPSDFSTKVAASVFDLPLDLGRELDEPFRRGFTMFEHVVGEALSDAALAGDSEDLADFGLAAGTSVNNLDTGLFPDLMDYFYASRAELDLARFFKEGRQVKGMFTRNQGEVLTGKCMQRYGLGGPSFVIDTACSASSHAIGEAFRLIRRGAATRMIAGGAAALVSPIHILAFERLRALSCRSEPEKASRPFDRDRDGFVMGEGAGAVILETLAGARDRGAPIYAELVGYGSNLTAYNLTDPSPEGQSEANAMSLALEDARMSTTDIDYVVAHGTSTPKGDIVETRAIRKLFGNQANRLLVSSNKGQLGHTISAAGVCNLIVSVKAIQENRIPPTANLENADPECDLDYVPRVSRAHPVNAVLVNSFGFGGQNATLAVRRLVTNDFRS